jgi:hypothetical protein
MHNAANLVKIDHIGDNNNNVLHVGDIHPNEHPAQNVIRIPDWSDKTTTITKMSN